MEQQEDIYFTDSEITVSGFDDVITLSVVRNNEPMLPTTFGITCRYRPGCENQGRVIPDSCCACDVYTSYLKVIS
ncbi:hypothetical protein BOW53_16380 [Solemya pervernicosa gill symbiont]|uniref:Uncharacterized protein n=1 Tax=Solemya pervernicosa gill symbiont TaxID=642797 RepID=A0A1T2KZ94_9GAMM|nr:hypothetical protein BOW53_16380 [Solemya pervernicosa gill symbiont]